MIKKKILDPTYYLTLCVHLIYLIQIIYCRQEIAAQLRQILSPAQGWEDPMKLFDITIKRM